MEAYIHIYKKLYEFLRKRGLDVDGWLDELEEFLPLLAMEGLIYIIPKENNAFALYPVKKITKKGEEMEVDLPETKEEFEKWFERVTREVRYRKLNKKTWYR